MGSPFCARPMLTLPPPAPRDAGCGPWAAQGAGADWDDLSGDYGKNKIVREVLES